MEGERGADEERVEKRKLLGKGEGQGTDFRPLFLDEGVGGSLRLTEGEGGAAERVEEQKLLGEDLGTLLRPLFPDKEGEFFK